MIATDMDGTLLNSESALSEATVQTLREAQAAGIHVCLATGRAMRSARPFAEQIGLKGPYVFVNGSEVWLDDATMMRRVTMPIEDVQWLRALAIEAGIWYWGYALDGVYNIERWHPDETAATWLKFGFMSDDLEVLAHIREQAAALGRFEISNSDVDNLEMNPVGIHKASGLELVCNQLGISMDQVIAFGDSQNDSKMLQAVGIGVAMGNAQESVKSIADAVTLTNDEDGVAAYIRAHVLA
jgi:hydroxymethylpyrimidine pyrophosphatase-like HAD family hydrolase